MDTVPRVVPIARPDMTLALMGGKGLNLNRLVQAGFPVPTGYVITTEAYQTYVEANGVSSIILAALAQVDLAQTESLELAAEKIRTAFLAGTIPADLRSEILSAYDQLGARPVAVRSSATAEDLPDLSFAGQQETFLNVCNAHALMTAVQGCWASLWTARAIGYRARHDIKADDIALAIVVQMMIESDVSGVLFTANPVTGLRTQTVIEATLGLGEALVSGMVEPDRYLVDARSNEILMQSLGAKATIARSLGGGGTGIEQMSAPNQYALDTKAITQLVTLGREVTAYFAGVPQDLEWAITEGKLYLLQARPITSLYPLPIGLAHEPLRVMGSFGAVQGILDPISPLGRDAMIRFLLTLLGLFNGDIDARSQELIRIAGERIFIDLTGMIRHPTGRKFLRSVLGVIEPAVGQIMEPLWLDPQLLPQPSKSPLQVLRHSLGLVSKVISLIGYSLLFPDHSRGRIQQQVNAACQQLREETDEVETLADALTFWDRTFNDLVPNTLPLLLPRLVAALAPLNLLMRLSRQTPDGEMLAMEITRGLPHNVTTEMDLSLWQTAQTIRLSDAAFAELLSLNTDEIARQWRAKQLHPVSQDAFDSFLKRYGVRGTGEIDLGRKRWSEDPRPIVQAVQSYLRIEDPEQAPDKVFQRGEAAAQRAAERLIEQLRDQPRAFVKTRLARAAIRRVRALAGLRETPKWMIVNVLSAIRFSLQRGADDLVASSTLQDVDDVFMLRLQELYELIDHHHHDWSSLIESRRSDLDKERRRQQIPRILLSDGRAFYDGLGASLSDTDGTLLGSPVSPGVVEGKVRIVLDPRHAGLNPGEIMVCPGTDPSWTPLFLAAAGLVMEVGGMMTHGSVVAREYGIPAVVGVHQATTRLKDGQTIRVDGSNGQIVLLDEGDGFA